MWWQLFECDTRRNQTWLRWGRCRDRGGTVRRCRIGGAGCLADGGGFADGAFEFERGVFADAVWTGTERVGSR